MSDKSLLNGLETTEDRAVRLVEMLTGMLWMVLMFGKPVKDNEKNALKRVMDESNEFQDNLPRDHPGKTRLGDQPISEVAKDLADATKALLDPKDKEGLN